MSFFDMLNKDTNGLISINDNSSLQNLRVKEPPSHENNDLIKKHFL